MFGDFTMVLITVMDIMTDIQVILRIDKSTKFDYYRKEYHHISFGYYLGFSKSIFILNASLIIKYFFY